MVVTESEALHSSVSALAMKVKRFVTTKTVHNAMEPESWFSVLKQLLIIRLNYKI